MPNAKTFAQHLIEKILPNGISITRPIDGKYLKELLVTVSERNPDDYARVVTDLKRLGDNLSTWEATSFGLDELSVPDKAKRDRIIKKYQGLVKNEPDPKAVNNHLVNLQKDLAELNMADGLKDDATLMVRAAIGGKATQLMKLRTSPGVVGGHDGKIVPEIFPTSYAEGVEPTQFWLGAAESRRNLAQGQVSTSEPGEISKIISNVLNSSVVSSEDCGTKRGIELMARDDDVVGRYLAAAAGGYPRNTKITADVQKALLKNRVAKIMVRSPQTCQATDNTVCVKCMGVRPGTGKPYRVGDNAGMITSGNISEPLTQMTLSAKHSTAMAGEKEGLTGTSGLRTFVEMPDRFPNRKVLCEVYGVVDMIRRAPQGGQLVTIRKTKRVPDRFIATALKSQKGKQYVDYYIAPTLEILENVTEGAEVYPGQELTTGIDNVKDVARLRNLGAARSIAAQGMYDVYKNTGHTMARSHFELLARNAHNHVKVEKAPSGFPFRRGEVVEYNKLEGALANLNPRMKATADAIGQTLAEGVMDLTAGTEITPQIAERLINAGIQRVKATTQVETSPATTPMSRVVNRSDDWVAALNHRYLQQQIKDAAGYGKRSQLHGYSPITSYAYGTEMTQGEKGEY